MLVTIKSMVAEVSEYFKASRPGPEPHCIILGANSTLKALFHEISSSEFCYSHGY